MGEQLKRKCYLQDMSQNMMSDFLRSLGEISHQHESARFLNALAHGNKHSKLQVKHLQSGFYKAKNKIAIICAPRCLWDEMCCLCNCPGFPAALTMHPRVKLLAFMDLFEALGKYITT